ncbi:AlpA family transcriptional regulator [Kangiella sp.]|uniref:helix-turn-helix transcriptional regulator n=1 Tax=Kangiella sp. TaxID=1920245 RepID=UPI0019C3C7E8|nr:AlpA family transcriptional regulator [Kangiella sp.]MBD3652364.1 AlpA family transcriptional regulator [Kangiella sp.]
MSTILRLNEVIVKTKLSRSTIYRFVNEGTFPKPISLGARAVGWSEQQINEWIEQKIQEANQGG